MKKFIFISTIIILAMITSCSEHKYPDLGDGYKFASDGNSTAIVNYENTVMVGTEILEYAFDSIFIIASQRPWDSIPNIRTMNYKESNEAFEQSTFRQYWIINKKEKNEYIGYSGEGNSLLAHYSNVYGPYKKEEYLQKRKELGVPKELQLEKK